MTAYQVLDMGESNKIFLHEQDAQNYVDAMNFQASTYSGGRILYYYHSIQIEESFEKVTRAFKVSHDYARAGCRQNQIYFNLHDCAELVKHLAQDPECSNIEIEEVQFVVMREVGE